MAPIHAELIIKAPASEIWNTLRVFGGIEKYLGIVSKSEVHGTGKGAIRTCHVQMTPNSETLQFAEEIEEIDENQRKMTYHVIDAPSPFFGLRSTIRVTPIDPFSSKVELTNSLTMEDPKEAVDAILSIFHMMLEGLKNLHE